MGKKDLQKSYNGAALTWLSALTRVARISTTFHYNKWREWSLAFAFSVGKNIFIRLQWTDRVWKVIPLIEFKLEGLRFIFDRIEAGRIYNTRRILHSWIMCKLQEEDKSLESTNRGTELEGDIQGALFIRIYGETDRILKVVVSDITSSKLDILHDAVVQCHHGNEILRYQTNWSKPPWNQYGETLNLLDSLYFYRTVN